jgi:hypothetical protein
MQEKKNKYNMKLQKLQIPNCNAENESQDQHERCSTPLLVIDVMR